MKPLTIQVVVWIFVVWGHPVSASANSYLPEAPSTNTESVDYGRQVMIADSVGLGFFLTSIALLQQDSPHFTTIGVSGAAAGAILLFGGPAVHLNHGQPKRAITSLAIRIGLPVLVGTLGAGIGEVADRSDTLTSLTYGLAGVAAGLVGAQIIDWFYLSEVTESKTGVQTRVQISSMPVQGGMALGIGGSW